MTIILVGRDGEDEEDGGRNLVFHSMQFLVVFEDISLEMCITSQGHALFHAFISSFLSSPSPRLGFELEKYRRIECMHHWIRVCVCVSRCRVDFASLPICLNLILHDRLPRNLLTKETKKQVGKNDAQPLVMAFIRTHTNPITAQRVNKNKRLRKHNSVICFALFTCKRRNVLPL